MDLDFEIDELTNSIRNVVTGDSFETDILRLTQTDVASVLKKSGWVFNWHEEFLKPEREIFKLTIVRNSNVIQGLICLQVKLDHVYMHLLESAPYNKGNEKVYVGVPGNLVAFACKLSFQRGFEGNVSFVAKTQLIDHYIESLGAYHFGGRLMIITTQSALNLVNRYYSNM